MSKIVVCAFCFTILVFSTPMFIAGCAMERAQPLYQVGEVVTHILSKEKMLVLRYESNGWSNYKCRLNDGTISWFYECELSDENGVVRYHIEREPQIEDY